jgi:hypothetical protein
LSSKDLVRSVYARRCLSIVVRREIDAYIRSFFPVHDDVAMQLIAQLETYDLSTFDNSVGVMTDQDRIYILFYDNPWRLQHYWLLDQSLITCSDIFRCRHEGPSLSYIVVFQLIMEQRSESTLLIGDAILCI